MPTTVSDPDSPPARRLSDDAPKIVGPFRIMPFFMAFAYQSTENFGRDPFPPMPNGAFPPCTWMCGSLKLLKMFPMRRGKKLRMAFKIPRILSLAALIGVSIADLIPLQTRAVVDRIAVQAEVTADRIARTGERTAFLMAPQVVTASFLIPPQTFAVNARMLFQIAMMPFLNFAFVFQR